MRIRLTVRAADMGRSWDVDEWTVLIALGALSAEPETMAEFFSALRRYRPNHCLHEAGIASSDVADSQSNDGLWCLIDLDARAVVAGDGFELPDRCASYQADDDDDSGHGFPMVWLDTPPEWLFQSAGQDWKAVVSQRGEAFASRPRIESRTILFGTPMLDFVARRVLADATQAAFQDQRYERIRAMHAEWLLTARIELEAYSPREVLLRHQGHISADIQHRSEQWSIQGFAPPPLAEESAACRFGGFGTTEIVLYFDLMRLLFDEAWESVIEGYQQCDQLVARLADLRDRWLAQPPEDVDDGPTCAELIDSERRRLPITDSGGHYDCDCPICQADADGLFGTGPVFMFYDGHHLELEDEFAFSLIASREEWEQYR